MSYEKCWKELFIFLRKEYIRGTKLAFFWYLENVEMYENKDIVCEAPGG